MRPIKPPKGIADHRGKWRYRFKVLGHPRVSRTTGLEATEKNLSAASELMAAHKRRLLLDEPEPLPAVLFDDAADAFQGSKDAEHRDKPATARRIKGSLASARIFFDSKAVHEITEANVEDYMTWRREDVVKEVTLRKDILALRMLSQFCVKRQWMDADPTADIKLPSDKLSRNERTITDEEETLYLEGADTLPALGDFARIMLRQGLRPEEVVVIQPEDVNFKERTLRIPTGKTAAARRTLKLHDDIAPIMARRIAEAQGPWLFPFLVLGDNGQARATDWSKPQEVEQVCKTSHHRVCRMKKLAFVPYSLRHTFATRFYRQTKDIVALKTILGHTDIRVTLRYINDETEQAFEAMEKFEKRARETVQ